MRVVNVACVVVGRVGRVVNVACVIVWRAGCVVNDAGQGPDCREGAARLLAQPRCEGPRVGEEDVRRAVRQLLVAAAGIVDSRLSAEPWPLTHSHVGYNVIIGNAPHQRGNTVKHAPCVRSIQAHTG